MPQKKLMACKCRRGKCKACSQCIKCSCKCSPKTKTKTATTRRVRKRKAASPISSPKIPTSSSSSSSHPPSHYISNIQNLLMCKCCEKLMKNPYCLPCHHSYCQDCIDNRLLTSVDAACFECKVPIQPKDAVRNIFLEGILQGWERVESELLQIPNYDAIAVLPPSAVKKKKPTIELENDIFSTQAIDLAMNSAIATNTIEVKRKAPQMIFAATGLEKDEIGVIRKAIKKLGKASSLSVNADIAFSNTSSCDVVTTHVICKWTNPSSRLVKRTVKYMVGLAAGCWIVDFSWIVESLMSGKWLDEEFFQVAGDSSTPHDQAKIFSPSYKVSKILFDIGFILVGQFRKPDVNKNSMEKMLRVCGASVVKLCDESENSSPDYIIASNDVTIERVRELYQQYRIPVVLPTWVMDCISLQEKLDYRPYLHLEQKIGDGLTRSGATRRRHCHHV